MVSGRWFPDRRRDVVFPVAGSVVLFGALVLGGLAYAALFGGSAERLVTAMLIDAVMVVGLQIYIGNTGVLSFGHIGFGAVAGYTFAILAITPERKDRWIPEAPWGLNEVQFGALPAAVVAVAVTMVVGVVIGIGLARSGARSGAVAATVITLALLFVSHEVAVNWTDLTGGNRAPLSFGIGDTLDSPVPILAVLLGSIVAARLFARSRWGQLAKAAREDNLAARAMGVDPQVQQMAALLLSVAVVALAASLRVFEIGNITPRFFFFEYTLLTLVMLIVGGRRSLTGGLVGVVVITAARELARRFSTDGFELAGLGFDGAPLEWVFREGLPTIVLGLAMLGFMIFRAEGLLDDWELDEWLYRRFGRRHSERPARLHAVAAGEADGADGANAGVAGGGEADDAGGVALVVAGLTVDFGGFRALGDAHLRAGVDEVVGLIGPNGAGKTTLVNAVTGIVEPTTGAVHLDAVELTRSPTHVIARSGLVRTFQNLRLFSAMTVREHVEVAALVSESHRPGPPIDLDALIATAGLWEQRHRRARQLDYGNARRLELARATAAAPTFLLLDEPTSGMSDQESRAMIAQVRLMAAVVGAGVVVIDHDLNFITGICDRIYCLDQGTVIAEGTPAEIQADPLVQAAYLGTTVDA